MMPEGVFGDGNPSGFPAMAIDDASSPCGGRMDGRNAVTVPTALTQYAASATLVNAPAAWATWPVCRPHSETVGHRTVGIVILLAAVDSRRRLDATPLRSADRLCGEHEGRRRPACFTGEPGGLDDPFRLPS
jgi:hypothetical protein